MIKLVILLFILKVLFQCFEMNSDFLITVDKVKHFGEVYMKFTVKLVFWWKNI